MTAEAVSFPNRNGRQLFGIFHPAGKGRKETCVVLLSPGIKNRVAPHRLYVKLSRHLQGLGYDVFRFDPEGLGDSEGECDFKWVADLYGAIQSGCFKEDTLAALDWLEANKGAGKFIVGGLCGGAITGMFAGRDDPRVTGLLSFGIPVVLESSDPKTERFVSEGQKDKLRRGYLARLFQPRSWLRLLTFQSDFRLLFKSLLRRRRPGAEAEAPSRGGGDPFNPEFPSAFVQRRGQDLLGVRGTVRRPPRDDAGEISLPDRSSDHRGRQPHHVVPGVAGHHGADRGSLARRTLLLLTEPPIPYYIERHQGPTIPAGWRPKGEPLHEMADLRQYPSADAPTLL